MFIDASIANGQDEPSDNVQSDFDSALSCK